MDLGKIKVLGHIKLCLCQGFPHWGSFVHVLLWMVAAGVMIPPACFSVARLGHARVSRPVGYSEYIACFLSALSAVELDV